MDIRFAMKIIKDIVQYLSSAKIRNLIVSHSRLLLGYFTKEVYCAWFKLQCSTGQQQDSIMLSWSSRHLFSIELEKTDAACYRNICLYSNARESDLLK